jgi:hypothetical protein
VELDLVDAVAVAVVRPEYGGVLIGGESVRERFLRAGQFADRGQAGIVVQVSVRAQRVTETGPA